MGGRDRRDKLPIDLKPLRRKLDQADDGGVSSPEVVDLDIDAHGLDIPDRGIEIGIVSVKGNRLEQFEGESAFSERGIPQFRQQRRVFQALCRDVDGDLRHVQTEQRPPRRLEKRFLEDAGVDVSDAIDALRDAQEPVGRQDASFRMVPPRQGLDAGYLKRYRIELRLEIRDDLVPFQCQDEIVGRLFGLQRRGTEFIRENLHATATTFLRFVKGYVGVDEQLMKIVARLVLPCDTCASAYPAFAAVDKDRGRKGGYHLRCQRNGPLLRIVAAGDQDEFVTTDPS